jgi:hypothetical protein
MRKPFYFRLIGWLTILGTLGIMLVVIDAAQGSGGAGATKEYAMRFEPECVIAPGVFNEREKTSLVMKAIGPASVLPGEAITFKEATISTPVESESLRLLGATEVRGRVTGFPLDATSVEPASLNIATPAEFPEGLPFVTPVERKEVTAIVPSEGRTFSIGLSKVTGSAGETAKLTVNSEPSFKEVGKGEYAATGKGITMTWEAYDAKGKHVIGPLGIACTVPAGVVFAEVPIVSSANSTMPTGTTTTSTTPVSSVTGPTRTDSTTSSTSPGIADIVAANAVVTANRSRAHVKLHCVGGGSCSGVLKLFERITEKEVRKPHSNDRAVTRVRNVMVGKVSFSIAAGESAWVYVRLTAEGATALRKADRSGLKVTLSGTHIHSRTLVLKVSHEA